MRPLVIFDCDGVLVDSEPLSLAVTREVLDELGCTLSEVDGYRHLLGRSQAHVSDWVRTTYGMLLGPVEERTMRERLMARLTTSLTGIPHVAEAVRRLDAAVCVASSSTPERIRHSLTVTDLLAVFEPNLFSATMVARGKPAPDLFLHAARCMGRDPADCVVVEDSPVGVDAAQAAGMRVIGFVGGSHAGPAGLPEQLAARRPLAVIADMRQLPVVLRATT